MNSQFYRGQPKTLYPTISRPNTSIFAYNKAYQHHLTNLIEDKYSFLHDFHFKAKFYTQSFAKHILLTRFSILPSSFTE